MEALAQVQLFKMRYTHYMINEQTESLNRGSSSLSLSQKAFCIPAYNNKNFRELP